MIKAWTKGEISNSDLLADMNMYELGVTLKLDD
jgi:hypothetical protein